MLEAKDEMEGEALKTDAVVKIANADVFHL